MIESERAPQQVPSQANSAQPPPAVDALLPAAIAAARAGRRRPARKLLRCLLAEDRANVSAWLWLSTVIDDPAEKARCLRQVLALEPGHMLARRSLERLQAGREARRGPWVLRNEFPLIAALGLLLVALISLDSALGTVGVFRSLPMVLLRVALGLAFVLFVPGYCLQAALFPGTGGSLGWVPGRAGADGAADLDGPERLALSFGLSVALVAPLALVLDRLPWGIRLWPIVVAEGLVIAACSAIAWWRRNRLPVPERFQVVVDVDPAGWWADQDRSTRLVYGALAGALLLAVGSALAVVVSPKPGEHFTEFYVLGPEGLAENYPRQAVAGEPVAVSAGITNREGLEAVYRIEAWLGEQPVGDVGPLRLADEETWQGVLSYVLPQPGDDQVVDIYLYRDGGTEPYRHLRLWIDVVEPPGS